MAYVPSVQSVTRLGTTTAAGANLNNSIFIAAHPYFKERQKPYASMEDVNSDAAIPKASNVYKALQQAFKQVGGASPIYVGRRQVDAITFTPTIKDSYTYSLKVTAYNTTTGLVASTTEASFTSDTDADDTEITAGLIASLDSPVGVIASGSVALVLFPAAFHTLVIEECVAELVQSYTTTEDAATCFSEITEEENEAFYFVTSEERDSTFVLELADAVDATENSDYKKQYRVTSDTVETLTVQTDPSHANDLLGLIEDGEYARVSGEWNDQSTEIFPELAACVNAGGYFAGSFNWKFMQGSAPAARHPVKGRLLNKAEQGYIRDRNASWVGKERGVSFMHGGTNAKGTSHFTDLVQSKDWIDDTIESRVLTALLNANNGGIPLTMTKGDLNIIKERVESVLLEAVDRKILAGFVPIVMPKSISFEDQANRILKDVKYTAYFAAKINFAIINGNLTYLEEIQ